MNVSDFLASYPLISDPNFERRLYAKSELYEVKPSDVPRVVRDSEGCSGALDHQVLLSRLMSAHAPFRGLLIFHALGTGKTRTAATICELVRTQSPPNIYTGAVVMARNWSLIHNFIREVALNCSPRTKLPDDFAALSSDLQLRAVKKATRDFYNFKFTFEMFAKSTARMTDEQIRDEFDNKIFILDEAHNLRLPAKTSSIDIYGSVLRVLSIARNTKVLLLSGTPIKDSIAEVASLLNLLIEPNARFNLNTFVKDYFTQRDGYYSVRSPEAAAQFKGKVKGLVSFLENVPSQIKMVFQGESVGKLRFLKVVPCPMSQTQERTYIAARNKDKRGATQRRASNISVRSDDDDQRSQELDIEEGVGVDATQISTGLSFNARQAAAFVFPDGSTGNAGFNAYFTKSGANKYKPTAAFLAAFRGASQLEQLSAKYARCIATIEAAVSEGKSCFVYSDIVTGSGAIVFSTLLNMRGFAPLYGSSSVRIEDLRRERRVAVLTNATASLTEMQNIIRVFNDPRNARGEYIAVIVGSAVISEGITLKNVQQCHILTPYFNYSQIWQAIGRGFRFGSHADVIRISQEQGLPAPEFQVFQYAAVAETAPSVDLEMYVLSEKKDYSNKQVERMLKEAAIDCALFWGRNRSVASEDFSRECDYQPCDYVCTGGVDPSRPPRTFDFSTKDLLYSGEEERNIRDGLAQFFRRRSFVSFAELRQLFSGFRLFPLLRVLVEMERSRTAIVNKFGARCFLKHSGGYYGLVQWGFGSAFDSAYTDLPVLSEAVAFQDVAEGETEQSLVKRVEDIFEGEARTAVEDVKRLPVAMQELVVEMCVKARQSGAAQNVAVRDAVLDAYKNTMKEIDGVLVSAILFTTRSLLRAFQDGEWRDATEREQEAFFASDDSEFEKLPIAGLYNDKAFCILLRRKVTQRNRQHSGRVCTSFKVPELVSIAFALGIENELTNDSHKSEYFLFNMQPKEKKVQELLIRFGNYTFYYVDGSFVNTRKVSTAFLENLSEEQIDSLWKLLKLQKEGLCDKIRSSLESQGFTEYDITCGDSHKRKFKAIY